MPRTVPIVVLHEEPNFVVLQTPGRRYPGVVIQGDSLAGIVGDLGAALQLFDTNREEARESLQAAHDELRSRLDQYNDICRENGVE